LIEQGLYRRIRHPAYAGVLLIFLVIGLALANRVSLVSLCVCPFIAFSVRMNVEVDFVGILSGLYPDI
jgi:protein-S-isoprenylcysteine O-methyltransferase Ste14